jgi:putative transcriptional regulator
MQNPTPQQIREARLDAGLTQTEAAELINRKLRTWQHWEFGDRPMDAAFYELFLMKTRELMDK